MTVVTFPKRLPHSHEWRAAEMQQIVEASTEAIRAGDASGWEVDVTERGDPQIFLLGPPPHCECILSISRLGRLYVIEDGAGRVLFEHDDPMLLAEHATAALRRRKAAIVARIAVAWCALREAVEEKAEALTAEPMELLTHFGPQLTVLA